MTQAEAMLTRIQMALTVLEGGLALGLKRLGGPAKVMVLSSLSKDPEWHW